MIETHTLIIDMREFEIEETAGTASHMQTICLVTIAYPDLLMLTEIPQQVMSVSLGGSKDQ